MKNQKSEDFIIDSILKSEFPDSLETWIKRYMKNHSLEKEGLITHGLYDNFLIPLVILHIKEFQKSKNPEILGQCINGIPELLHHPIIRDQIYFWIIKSKLTIYDRQNDELRSDIRTFVKGLIPKFRAGNVRDIELEYKAKEKLTPLYKLTLEILKEKFDNFRKKENRKLFQGDRARILRETFFPPEPSKNKDAIKIAKKYNKTAENYLNDLAKNYRASVIARKLIKDLAYIKYDIKIGEKKLANLIYKEIETLQK